MAQGRALKTATLGKRESQTPTIKLMGSIFKSLPGVTMSVSDVMQTLSRMWDKSPDDPTDSAAANRASQLNLILHFGLHTTAEEAKERFDQTVRFAQRYPCRIIVLCPEGRNLPDINELEGKLFAQCYIGLDSLRSMCCCEALMLGYPTRDAGYLNNMVSIWLENDLPTYHWFNRVPAERIRDLHLSFIKNCRRIIWDSSIEPADFYATIPWPQGATVKDLAVARMLPVRQSIGQFLSGYEPSVLVDGLQSVQVTCQSGMYGEAHHLLRWQQEALQECAQQAQRSAETVRYHCDLSEEGQTATIHIRWRYANDQRSFDWSYERSESVVRLQADLGKGKIDYITPLVESTPELALAEAMFFG